jgi:hypothetical protein
MTGMNLSPRWRKLLLVVHLVAAVGWVGAELVLLALAVSGVRGTDPRTVYPAAGLVGAWLVAPLALVTLGTGLLQGLLTPWGLIRHWWVTIKLALTTLMTGLVFFALLPGLRAAAGAATGSGTAGAAIGSGALTAAERAQFLVPPSVASSLLVLNVILSVYKPGGRLRRV